MSKGMLSPSGATGVPLSRRNLATAALAMGVPSGKLSENKEREDAEAKAYELTRKTMSDKGKKLT
jgi:hypothetical protein